MILGTGIDAVSIRRVEKLSRHFIEKVYSKTEIEEYEKLESACPEVRNSFLASRFAVKEAYAKARGLGFCSSVKPCEISTVKDKNGKPCIVLEGKTLDEAPLATIHLSITHEEPLAIAFVVLEEVSNVQA